MVAFSILLANFSSRFFHFCGFDRLVIVHGAQQSSLQFIAASKFASSLWGGPVLPGPLPINSSFKRSCISFWSALVLFWDAFASLVFVYRVAGCALFTSEMHGAIELREVEDLGKSLAKSLVSPLGTDQVGTIGIRGAERERCLDPLWLLQLCVILTLYGQWITYRWYFT